MANSDVECSHFWAIYDLWHTLSRQLKTTNYVFVWRTETKTNKRQTQIDSFLWRSSIVGFASKFINKLIQQRNETCLGCSYGWIYSYWTCSKWTVLMFRSILNCRTTLNFWFSLTWELCYSTKIAHSCTSIETIFTLSDAKKKFEKRRIQNNELNVTVSLWIL